MTSPYRTLPGVDALLSDARIAPLVEQRSRPLILDFIRSALSDARRAIADGAPAPSSDDIIAAVAAQARAYARPWPRRLINATGVILHTNLGRAPLSHAAIAAIQAAAQGYSELELDLASGRRGSRQARISELVSRATGADAALVVNNNASAVMLGLAAIAVGKEVIVSRGEAVEIGGGFRVPDMLRQSGATLVEVGTTNRTYARDYGTAITPNTGALLAVHASNFRVMGFTHTPQIAEIVDVGNRHGIPVLHDLGSGCLLDATEFGLAHEPMPQESVSAGVGLSFFSGDKLLGGPQAGIIAGKRELIDIVARHPLARAMRIDKLSMAGLAATLMHYISGEAVAAVPIWQMIAAPADALQSRAGQWAAALGNSASIAESRSTIGGGSLPGETLPSWVVAIDCRAAAGGAEEIAKRMRQAGSPVIGRIESERILLDPRTVLPTEDDALLRTLTDALPPQGQPI